MVGVYRMSSRTVIAASHAPAPFEHHSCRTHPYPSGWHSRRSMTQARSFHFPDDQAQRRHAFTLPTRGFRSLPAESFGLGSRPSMPCLGAIPPLPSPIVRRGASIFAAPPSIHPSQFMRLRPATPRWIFAVPYRNGGPVRVCRWARLFALLLPVATFVGCATGRLNNPFETAARKQSPSATAQGKSARDTDARKVAGVASKGQPGASETRSAGGLDKGASSVVAASSPNDKTSPVGPQDSLRSETSERALAGVATPAGASRGASLDAETLALIDRELRDASPDERSALFHELKSVHPQMVREILRIRRMGIQYREQQRAVAQSTAPPPSGVETASHQDAAGPRMSSDPGLGQNPWEIGAVRHTTARAPLGGHTATVDSERTPLSRTPDSPSSIVAPADMTVAAHAPATSPNSPAPPPSEAGPRGSPAEVAQAMGTAPGSVPPTVPPTSPVQTAAASVPVDAAPLPDPGRRSAPLVPGQYDVPPAQGWVAAVPGKAASVAQPVVANVQRALQDLSRPIRPGATPATGKEPSPPPSGNGPPVAADGSPAAEARPGEPAPAPELVRLIDAMERFTASIKPGTTPEEQQFFIEQHVYLRMLYLIASRHERALQAIPGIPTADQEFWQQTLWGIANYFDTENLPRDTDRATQTVAQFATAISRLQQKAQLKIRNTHFCRRIDSYGSYERFDRDDFTPGQPVLLYTEIENFHTEPTSDGRHRTLLKSTLEVFRPGPNGELVDRFEFPATEDLCRNPRRDYFHSYEFTIPTKLGLGPHVLKLTLEDQLTRKVATYSVNFTVR